MLKSIIFKYLTIVFLSATYVVANPVKITFVERICEFIEWPSKMEKNFNIGIYQHDDLYEQMNNAYKNKKLHELPIDVVNIKNASEIKSELNVIYFTQEIPPDVIKRIKKFPVLIISDVVSDINNNAHLVFYFEDKKIKFMINKSLLDQSNFKASYKLLKLAKIIEKGQ